MTYQITIENYLHTGEMVKKDTKNTSSELFVMYDINGKKHYSGVMSIVAEFDNLESALKYQKSRENRNAKIQKNQ